MATLFFVPEKRGRNCVCVLLCVCVSLRLHVYVYVSLSCQGQAGSSRAKLCQASWLSLMLLFCAMLSIQPTRHIVVKSLSLALRCPFLYVCVFVCVCVCVCVCVFHGSDLDVGRRLETRVGQ